MFKRPNRLGLACILVATSTPVLASTCAQRDQMVGHLQTKFAEQLTVGGLQRVQSSLSVLEIWSSDETGTYTVLLTNPNGISCILAAGTDFFEAARTPVEKGTAG